jgi:hypothetical protein
MAKKIVPGAAIRSSCSVIRGSPVPSCFSERLRNRSANPLHTTK